MRIIGAALENDVHVAGLVNFLHLAEEFGHTCINLGPAVSVAKLLEEASRQEADLIAVSYRLTPENARRIFQEIRNNIPRYGLTGKILVCGGTPPVAKEAEGSGIFQVVFSGLESIEEIRSFLKGDREKGKSAEFPQDLEARIRYRAPFPLVRHHFGLPDLDATIEGARQIAEAGVLDILSLGPDQNAQESFFRPEEMDCSRDGAGGVPLRKPDDLERIYAATRCGNYPLLRCYAGTRDLIKWAEMTHQVIRNAWGAVPIFWYSRLDARSDRPLEQAIEENLQAMSWHASHCVPLEINDAHQWSLRYAPDAVAVADAYICAHIARSLGIQVYVAQYMFNTPPETSAVCDLGKMLAKRELIESLRDADFRPVHMARAGLMHFSPDPAIAKGQLSASTALAMQLEPQILHVVGYSEGDHAVQPGELIESVKIVQGVLRNLREGMPDLSLDPRVQRRKQELLEESQLLLKAIRLLGKKGDESFLDPQVLTQSVRRGILFAPHILSESMAGQSQVTTKGGCCRSASTETGEPIEERERLRLLGIEMQ